MEFKIDTKATYILITPESTELNEIMAESLCHKVKELFDNEHKNFIINLANTSTAQMDSSNALLELHQLIYNNGGSLVFTNLQESVLLNMKKEQLHLSLNITPTLIEAADIVHMEVLERDLLNEL